VRIASHNEGLLHRTDIKGKDIYQPGQRGFNSIKVRKREKYSGAGICLCECITFSQCSAKKCSTFNLKIVSERERVIKFKIYAYTLNFIALSPSLPHTNTHTLAHSLTYHHHTPTPQHTQLTDILSPRIHCSEPRDFEGRSQPDKEK